MKHIFVVHSNITYLSALGVVALEGLSSEEYLLVGEGFSAAPIPVVQLPYWRGLRANKWRVGSYLHPARATDKRIDQLTQGEPFTLYFSVATKLARTLLTHKRCVDFCLIEEGTSAYSITFSPTTLTTHDGAFGWRTKSLWQRFRSAKLLVLRGYTPRLAALPIFYPAYASPKRLYYGFTDQSHILAPKEQRRVLDLRALPAHFGLKQHFDLSQRTIWLGDCIDFDGSAEEAYFKGFEEGFILNALVANGIGSICVKFHYREIAASRSRTLSILARYEIQVELLPDSALMEIELLFAQGAKLYGTYSSLLLYGALAGVEAWSIDRYYGQGVIDERIPILWNYVQRL